MSLPRNTSRIFRRQLRAHVAWPPLSNNLELGDFGVFKGGVFERLGNIKKLGVDFELKVGPASPFDFRSGGVTEVSFDADVKAGKTQAGLKIHFASADSLYLRSKRMLVFEIGESLPVALALRKHPEWRMRYRVVYKLWRLEDAVFITTEDRDAEVEIGGSLAAVRLLKTGSAAAGLKIMNKRGTGLESIGATGPAMLGLFRVRLRDSTPDPLDFAIGSDPADPAVDPAVDPAGLIEESDPQSDPEDDPEDDLQADPQAAS